MASVACNIVLLPEPDLAQKSIAASQLLAQSHDTHFVLEDGEYYPHATLYMVQLKTEDLPRAQDLLASIATHTAPLTLQVDQYMQAEGYIDANYVRTPEADAVHWAVVHAINPIRDGMREKNKQRMAQATGLTRENFEMYGDHRVGDLFRPHITLTRLGKAQPIDASILPPPSAFNGTFTRLGLFEMGDNGTCVHKVAEFPFAA